MIGVLIVAFVLAWFSAGAVHPSSRLTGAAWFVLFANLWFIVIGLVVSLAHRKAEVTHE